MTGIIVRLHFSHQDGASQARVLVNGEIDFLSGTLHEHRTAGKSSQLLTIRHMARLGWRVSRPSEWEEAQA